MLKNVFLSGMWKVVFKDKFCVLINACDNIIR